MVQFSLFRGRSEGVSPFSEAMAALNASGVVYVAVGGLAVVLHGANRLTVDID